MIPSLPLQVVTRQALTFRLRPPGIDSPSRAPAKLELEVTNHSTRGAATVALAPPEGWRAEPTSFACDLGPGERRRLPFTLSAPDQGVSFWHHRDAQLGLDWRLGERSGRASVRVRGFPAMFSVYHDGPEKLILHGYPNVLLQGNDFEAAKRELLAGGYVALWLSGRNPEGFRPLVEWFLAHGGGVVSMGQPFGGESCPVTPDQREPAVAKAMILAAGDTPALRIAAPVARFRTYYESENGFRGWKVTARDWAEVAATWSGSATIASPELQGRPAIVVSKDPARRIAFTASDLETTTEDTYHFEERVHRQRQWYLTYYFYHLLAWAAGTQS
jgi:hypothetical protein